ncbi:17322_t:CDS:2 [Funneliformis caledonium]|uniref:17322_t:CDS:1 n=1 Tax=Funneliformis caledonium TaxID=1117310 RepID=A0A9N9EXP1_9GLOM|nr:17322_t:CDS:2 [Funneliformis caledonium]
MENPSHYNISDNERIILNVGGIKYETYRTTLTRYPETLLGTMFQERNNALLIPKKENEYFFDRNSKAFHYILEYYRTGKLIWPNYSLQDNNNSSNISCEELIIECDFFQIPIPEFIKSRSSNYILFSSFSIETDIQENKEIRELLKPFAGNGYNILQRFEVKIKQSLMKILDPDGNGLKINVNKIERTLNFPPRYILVIEIGDNYFSDLDTVWDKALMEI